MTPLLTAEHRLATYGSLGPGRANHAHVAGHGFPALVRRATTTVSTPDGRLEASIYVLAQR